MADGPSRLPVELNQEYRVKLGRSFIFPKENAFHSIKYDFKPKSIDPSQPGRLKVKGDEVSVFMPVLQAETAEDVAVFKGSGKPCRKECILIINTVTGEAVLEKISNTLNLKGVRDLTKKKKFRSTSPIPSKTVLQSKPHSHAISTKNKAGKTIKRKSTKQDTKHEPTDKQQQQQLLSSNKAPPTSSISHLIPTTSISPIRSNNPTPEPHPLPQPKIIKLSHSSNSDDSSSSSSDSSDSDSDVDQSNSFPPIQQFTSAPPPATVMPIFLNSTSETSTMVPPVPYIVPNNNMPTIMGEVSSSSSGSSSSSSSGSSSSDSDTSDIDTGQTNPGTNEFMPSIGLQQSSTARPRTMSVLKKDLELSDSDESDL